jgi:hypothetical protein
MRPRLVTLLNGQNALSVFYRLDQSGAVQGGKEEVHYAAWSKKRVATRCWRRSVYVSVAIQGLT